MSRNPVAFLIAGATGAGKTTYAIKLANKLEAVRFSIDEWMAELFYADMAAEPQFDWVMERINRCEAQMWSTAQQVLYRGGSVILDLGFTTRDHREKFRKLASEAGYQAVLHYVDAPDGVRWERVQQRNTERGETFRVEVTREMFEFMENMLEVPNADELAGGRVVDSAQ